MMWMLLFSDDFKYGDNNGASCTLCVGEHKSCRVSRRSLLLQYPSHDLTIDEPYPQWREICQAKRRRLDGPQKFGDG